MKIKYKNLAQLLSIYFVALIFGTILFVSLFWLDFLRNIDILFFKAFVLLIVSCAVLMSTLILLKLKVILFKLLTYRDILIISLMLFIFNNMLYLYIPFNVSRSVSVMIVGHLYHHQNQLISEQNITEHIFQLYFKNEDAVRRRLNEQIEIGNIEKVGSTYKLTPKGIGVVKFMGLITSVYNTEPNYAQ